MPVFNQVSVHTGVVSKSYYLYRYGVVAEGIAEGVVENDLVAGGGYGRGGLDGWGHKVRLTTSIDDFYERRPEHISRNISHSANDATAPLSPQNDNLI